MQDLTLVGLTEDKSKLVLAGPSGEKLALPVDAKLRAALRGDLAGLGQRENRMESALRPRDIQARIRAGDSPEAVAEAAQTTVDRIMTYATPVLAERAHIAERAQRASVRRRAGEGSTRVLWDAVAEQLRSKSVDPESVTWDSWRREDGRWHVVASYQAAERSRRAEFVFDVHGRYVVAEDEEARWLVGEPVGRGPQDRPGAAGGGPHRLSGIGRGEAGHLGDDAIELVASPETDGPSGPEEQTVDLTDAARELRGGAHRPRVDELAITADADWMATQATDRPDRPREAAPEPTVPPGEAVPEQPGPAEESARAEEQEQADVSPLEDAGAPVAQEAPEAEPVVKKTGRKGRRASVPSWDEIMFGGGGSD